MDLSDKDLQRFKSLLLKQKAEMLSAGETGQQAEQVVELDQTRVGRLSRMDAMQAQAMSQATNQRREATLQAIAGALLRIDKGVYGECGQCGEYIDPRRLEFDPTLRRCINCA